MNRFVGHDFLTQLDLLRIKYFANWIEALTSSGDCEADNQESIEGEIQC